MHIGGRHFPPSGHTDRFDLNGGWASLARFPALIDSSRIVAADPDKGRDFRQGLSLSSSPLIKLHGQRSSHIGYITVNPKVADLATTLVAILAIFS